MKHIPPPTSRQSDLDHLQVALFHWLLWAVYIVAKLGAPKRSTRLERYLRRCERFLEYVLFIHACRRFGPRQRRRVRLGWRPGFRIVRSNWRLVLKIARVRARGASLRERAERLLHVFGNFERYLARFKRRLRHGLGTFRLVVARPRAVALAGGAPRGIAIADSS